jgi:hypothetical protein
LNSKDDTTDAIVIATTKMMVNACGVIEYEYDVIVNVIIIEITVKLKRRSKS